jgi:predicted  nucleic acid-binding Zn-ribbon protein
MENMFVWILIFAGAAIVLMGVFWIASERELKKKRLEIEKLTTQLDESPMKPAPAPTPLTQAAEGDELAELQARNEELHKEIANLSAKLELGRRAIEELEGGGPRDEDSQVDARRLRAANDALTGEIKELKERLQAGEARISASIAENLEATRRQRQLQGEIEELQKQLTESQSKARELENSQQQRAHDESLETIRADERRQWETKIGELERELASARERLGETESLRRGLEESERLRQALENENRKHEQDIPRWQARVAQAEENRHRLAGLRSPFDDLLAEHAEIADRQKRFEENLAEFGGLMALSVSGVKEANGGVPTYPQTFSAPPAVAEVAAIAARQGATDHIDEQNDETQPIAPEQLTTEGNVNKGRKRRFGLFSLVVLLPIAAAFAFGTWNTPAQHTDSYAKPALAPAPKSEHLADKAADTSGAGAEADAVQLAAKPREAAKPAAKETGAATKPPQSPRLATKVSGTYEITQPSRIYAAPTEFSQLIGDIEPGVKVNVVNARDGWLEIHSKHGRPPGYIRKEAAARVIAQN